MRSNLRLAAAVATAALAAGMSMPAAAQVTFERLLNPEPENWLRDHGNYANHRFTQLTQITKENVGELELKYIFSIGGRATGGTLAGKEECTPLVDAGFMYVCDSWARVMKFDITSGDRAIPLWRYNPEITKSRTQRGMALWGDSVLMTTNDTRVVRLNAESGEVIWEVQAAAPPHPEYGTPSPTTQGFTAAPTTLRTAGGRELVLQGESTGGQRGTISWVGAWDIETGELAWRWYAIPFPGEPGHETWADDHGAWRTGGGGLWQSPAFDPELNLAYYGTGDAMPTFDPEFRPGDNLYTASTVALNVDNGALAWYFQEVPNEQWDFDSPNPRMLYELNGRKVVANFSRNGFYYTHDRATGEFISAAQFQTNVNWTAGIDAKTGRPVDYNPETPVQNYAGVGPRRNQTTGDSCPTWNGAPSFFPPAFNPDLMIAYAQGVEGCLGGATLTAWPDPATDRVAQGAGTTVQRTQPAIPVVPTIWALDVEAGEVLARAQREGEPFSESGILATASGMIFAGHSRGDFTAYDGETLEPLYTYNLGMEISAPAISYSQDGTQYVAIVAGGDGAGLWQRSAIVAVFGLDD